jgi:hypothetical protein
MNFSLGCSLVYRVKSPTPFVFNFEAARFDVQTVRKERLELIPKTSIERWTMPESGNRYLRILGEPVELRVRYEAEVELSPRLEDPDAVTEISAGQLPFEVLTHLYPSRYCQSDKLVRFAGRTFRDLPPGYHRVNGVCNWIRDNVDYALGSSDLLTSAFDTVTQRIGVCRLRPPGHRALPCPWHSGPLRQRIRLALGPAGLPCGFRSVLERALRCRLAPVRPDANVGPEWSGAHRHRPGRRGGCVLHFL